MLTKISTFLAVLAFVSSSSVAFACDTSCKKGDGDDKGDTEASAVYEGSGCGGGASSCDRDKKDGK